jgi:tRNA A-37 threonylcarbamoyl transferase component Bud32
MVTHGQHHHEVVLFESSLSVNDRRKHSREDRVKLAHATACALKTIREASSPQPAFGVVGVHLHYMDGVYKVTASVMVVNKDKFVYELHTLFDLPVPLALKTRKDLTEAVEMLVQFNALARFVRAQLKVAGSSGGKVGADESEGKADDMEREDADGGGGQGGGGGVGSPRGKAPPTDKFKPTPGSKKPSGNNSRKATLSQAVGPAINVLFEPPTVGGHARVFRGVVRSDHHGFGFASVGAEVALKVSCESDYCLREVRALHHLAGVPGVVPLLDLRECDRGLVLVLPWLQPMALDTPTTQPREHEQLVLRLLHVVVAIHARGVAHCDLKPDAVMRMSADELVLVDFNLARGVNEPLDGELPGTAGWVFTGAPASTGATVDRVALAAIIGWLLRVPGCGNPTTTFEQAVAAISSAHNTASGSRSRLLQAAASLLCSTCAIVDIAEQLATPAACAAVQDKENPVSRSGGMKSPRKEPLFTARAPLGDLGQPL